MRTDTRTDTFDIRMRRGTNEVNSNVPILVIRWMLYFRLAPSLTLSELRGKKRSAASFPLALSVALACSPARSRKVGSGPTINLRHAAEATPFTCVLPSFPLSVIRIRNRIPEVIIQTLQEQFDFNHIKKWQCSADLGTAPVGLAVDSEHKIVCSLSATKPTGAIPMPGAQ